MDDCYDLIRDLKAVFGGRLPSKEDAENYLCRSLTAYESSELYGSTKTYRYRSPEQQVEDLEWGGVEEPDW
jgi:hypothetical protein